MKYIIKGRACRGKKQKITTGFWLWKQKKDITEIVSLYEFTVRSSTSQIAIRSLMSFDKRIESIVIDSVEAVCK